MINSIEKIIKRIDISTPMLEMIIQSQHFNTCDLEKELLNDFNKEIEECLLISKNVGMYDRFIDVLEKSGVQDKIITVDRFIKNNPEHLTGYINLDELDVFKSLANSIPKLQGFLKVLSERYSEFLNEDGKSLIDNSKIDKEQVLKLIEKSLEEFNKVEDVPKKEREQIVIIHKEIIKEVKKEKTSWEKVTGFIVGLATVVTLYTGGPEIAEDLTKAYYHINSHLKVDQKKVSIPFDEKAVEPSLLIYDV